MIETGNLATVLIELIHGDANQSNKNLWWHQVIYAEINFSKVILIFKRLISVEITPCYWQAFHFTNSVSSLENGYKCKEVKKTVFTRSF